MSKTARQEARKMSLKSCTMRIIVPAMISLHVIEKRMRLAARKW